MIVVADTSPLNYLVLLGKPDILPKIYGRVVVPTGVVAELSHPDWSQVALELGYFDQAHLINDFRSIVGHLPAEYQKLR